MVGQWLLRRATATEGSDAFPRTRGVELGGFVESGDVGNGVDGRHGDRPIAVAKATTAELSNVRSTTEYAGGIAQRLGGGRRGRRR